MTVHPVLEDRVCSYPPCGKPLIPRSGETPSQVRRRTCCDASCANRLAQGSTTPMDLPGQKTCEECGHTTRRRDGESPARWAARQFCSRLCASRYSIRQNTLRVAAVAPESKRCVECGVVFVRRSGERSNRWKAREFCGRSCASKLKARRNGTPVTKPKPKPKPVKPAKKPKPAPAPPLPVLPVVERPTGPVWRPAGLSPTPNAWAGHRAQVSLRKAAS